MAKSYPTVPVGGISTSKEFDIPYEHCIEFDYTTFPDADPFAAICDRHELTIQIQLFLIHPMVPKKVFPLV